MIKSNNTITYIKNTKSFKINSERISKLLHISKEDAEQELLVELLLHRLKDYDDASVRQVALTKLEWSITYATRDVFRRKNTAANKQKQAVEECIKTLDLEMATDTDVMYIAEQLSETNFNRHIKAFILCMFQFGTQETMTVYQLNKKQLQGKIRNIRRSIKRAKWNATVR